MSRAYNMGIEISGHDTDKTMAIKDAANGEWEFDDWDQHDGKLIAYADGHLGGGETEEQFAERLTKTAWRANGKFCYVSIVATYLEDFPYEKYSFDEDDFERLKAEIEDNADASSDAAAKPK